MGDPRRGKGNHHPRPQPVRGEITRHALRVHISSGVVTTIDSSTLVSEMNIVGSPVSTGSRDHIVSDGDARSRSLSGGRAIGTIKLVEPTASDLPTVETSAPHEAGGQSGVQIVVTGPDNIARSVVFERTDSLSTAFEIMQHAGLLPPDPLPWLNSRQQLTKEQELRAQRMSDEFAFAQGAPSALISSRELEQGGNRISGDINQTMDTLARGSGDLQQGNVSVAAQQGQSVAQIVTSPLKAVGDLYDMRRLSEDLNRLSEEFHFGGATPQVSDPNVFVPGGMDVDQRLSDARMSERVSSMDPAVLGTLLDHSEKVKQQHANEFAAQRTS